MAVDGRYDIELNWQGLALYKNKINQDFEGLYETPRELATTQGEATRNPFWWQKRYSDFSGGYDQLYSESRDSSVNRFYDSSGIDVTTPGEIRLMRDMTTSLSKAGTNGYLLSRKGKLILVDGTNINHMAGGAWTEDVATGAGTAILAQTSDGNLYYVTGSTGNMRRTADWSSWLDHSTSGAGDNSTDITIINNILYGVEGQKLYKINSGSTANTVIYDTGNDAWTLNNIVEHNKKIAFSAWRGVGGAEKSYIYESDGTAAGTKMLVDDLPLGFKVYRIYSYSDIVWIVGGWVTTPGSGAVGVIYAYANGVLRFIGRLNETAHVGYNNPTAAATIDTIPRVVFGHGQYIYFGMNEGSGLWRYDLKYGGLSRSWSAASGTNQVTGAAWFRGKVYIAYSGAGAFVEDTSFVSSGWIKTPATTMDSGNPKIGRKIRITGKTDKTAASYSATDDVGYTLYATSSNNYKRAQTFLTTSAGKLKEVIVKITASTTAKKQWLKCELRNVSASLPGATVYDTAYLYATDVSSANEAIFQFGSDYQVANATNYALVFSSNAPISGLAFTIRAIGTGGYSDGQTCVSSATSESWSAVSGTDIPFTVILSKTDSGSDVAPFAVSISKDVNTTWLSLKKSDTYGKEFPLRNANQWDSLMAKITITDSDVVLQDLTIEAVPTLSDQRIWTMTCDLTEEMVLINGETEMINPQKVWEALQTARANKVPVTYRDIDYDKSAAKTVYRVLIESLSRDKMYIDDEVVEGLLQIRLREF